MKYFLLFILLSTGCKTTTEQQDNCHLELIQNKSNRNGLPSRQAEMVCYEENPAK